MINHHVQNLEQNLNVLDEPLRNRVLDLRRWFHRHPELSFKEAETATHIIEELELLGISYDYAGVGHAVIAHIDGETSSGPAIALRADMDALPGDETTGASYASENPGIMHACGHCAHMAMLLGAAHLLRKNPPPGPVRLVFQPAEESGGGARVAIKDGALEDVAAIFAGHVSHEFVTGKIMVRDGSVTAQSDGFAIRVCGKGGHGARPHEAVDAIVVSSFLITALQTLVSRETNPLHPSVITIGSFHAGSAGNVIAENASAHRWRKFANTFITACGAWSAPLQNFIMQRSRLISGRAIHRCSMRPGQLQLPAGRRRISWVKNLSSAPSTRAWAPKIFHFTCNSAQEVSSGSVPESRIGSQFRYIARHLTSMSAYWELARAFSTGSQDSPTNTRMNFRLSEFESTGQELDPDQVKWGATP
jgi:hypothetical protein